MLTTNESVENYLETILVLSQKLPVVRSVDVANETGYKKSSVSVAMKNLKENGYIKVDMRGTSFCLHGSQVSALQKRPQPRMPARSNTL